MAFLYAFGWAAPLFHHHPLDIRSVEDASIAAHTCGDVEHHIPLDAFHACEVCWQANQRVSLPAMAGSPVATMVVTGDVPEYRPDEIPQASLLLPDKRGPPAVA